MEKKVALIVDDMELNREILAEILNDEYEIIEAENGVKAIEVIKSSQKEISGILLDIVMPEMDGFEVLDFLKYMQLNEKIPVLVISGEDDVATKKKCFEYGVADFINKPFDNVIVKQRTKNVIELYAYKNSLEKRVELQSETLVAQYQRLNEQAEKLKQTNIEIIEILGNIVENRDVESGEHVERVKDYTKILATILMSKFPEYGLDPEKVERIVEASVLHDVGKISIPDSILLKPGRLTPEEFECMKVHTIRGGGIIERIGSLWSEDYMQLTKEICLYHHERYDGRGYPEGLKGEEIPIAAQIVSIADVYDALVSDRCYKRAYSPTQAYMMITRGECGSFSPKILKCFTIARKQFEALAMLKSS